MLLTILETANRGVWAVMIPVTLLCGGYLTLRSRAFQLRGFPGVLKHTVIRAARSREPSGGTTMSPFRAACTALAGTIGTGNLIGVATAISVGGAGSVFWMWVAALLGMMLSYTENYLGSISRERTENGWRGGAMLYMKKFLFWRRAPAVYAALAAALGLLMGGMLQSNTVAAALRAELSVPRAVTGLVLAAAVTLLAAGGVSAIGRTVERLVPLMALLYTAGTVVLLVIHIERLPAALGEIFAGAFSLRAGIGGAAGAGIAAAARYGMARGIFSNEAGLGTAALAHAASSVRSGHEQGMWGIFEVFFDTIVMCSLSALVILTTRSAGAGPQAVQYAFTQQFGRPGGLFVCAVLLLFGFSTILNWSYLGSQAYNYLFGGRNVLLFSLLFFLAVSAGAVFDARAIWELSDLLLAAMLALNLPAVMMLHKKTLVAL